MRCIKMLGLAGLATVALMAFAGAASATTLTSPAKTPYTSMLVLRSGNIKFDFALGGITCTESEAKAKVEFHGNGITAGGKMSSLTFANCGAGNTFTVLKAGSLEFEATTPAGNGLVKWTNGEVQVHISGGFTCTIKTSNTPIGTLTGSNITKGNAVLDLNASKVPVSGAFCGTSAEMTNLYAFITPETLEVDAMI